MKKEDFENFSKEELQELMSSLYNEMDGAAIEYEKKWKENEDDDVCYAYYAALRTRCNRLKINIISKNSKKLHPELSEKEIHIIKHTVGLNNNPEQKGDFYRNRFVAGPGAEDWNILNSLVEKDIMGTSKPLEAFNKDQVFYLTEKGLNIAKTFQI